MKVLVDTSVWVAHFQRANADLVQLLQAGQVLIHPMVIAELACGTPPDRARTLRNLSLLEQAHEASWAEVMFLLDREKLFGRGCGLVDMALLASALMTPGAVLWTFDKRLDALAKTLGVMHRPSMH